MEHFYGFFKLCIRPFTTCCQINVTSLSKLVFIYLCFRNITDGMEEFLIQPTAWYYMKYLGQSTLFLGLTMAAYSTGTLVFAPFIGFLEAKCQSTKTIVLITGLVKFCGNLLYSIPVNGYFPLFGRFLSGLSEGTMGVLYGVVAKCTTNENRAKAFLYFEGLYSIGVVCGPMVGSVLTFNLNIFGWKINAGNSPAVILMLIWVFLLSLTILLPNDLTENSEEITKNIVKIDSDDENSESNCGNTTTRRMSNVLCLYYLIFHITICNEVISFDLPLLSKYHLGLGLRYIKLIYLNGTLAGVLSYLAAFIFVEKFSEKICIVFSTVLTIIPVSVIFYFALLWYDNMPVSAVYLLLVSMIIVRGVYVNFSLTCSVLSKLTPVENATFYQSLTFTIAHMAVILGRLIAGMTFSRLPMMYTCLCLTISWLVGLIWVGIEYKNL